MEKDKIISYILIVLILCLSFLVYFLLVENIATTTKIQQYQDFEAFLRQQNKTSYDIERELDTIIECQEGMEQNCYTKNNCVGKKICIGGKWSECYQNKICQPGKRVLCSLDGCSFGYKTCNECGDGWSECQLQ